MSKRLIIALSALPAGPGSSDLYLDSGGNVGIGTTTPDRLLELQSSSHTRLGINAGTSSESIIHFDRQGSFIGQINTKSDNSMWFYAGASSASPKLVLDSTGNVGIGTTAPSKKLDVVGDIAFGANSYGLLEQDTSVVRFRNITSGEVHLMTHDGNEDINLHPSGYIQFEAAGVEAMRIISSGNVGIGTTAPGVNKLQVSGNIYSDGVQISPGNFLRVDAVGVAGGKFLVDASGNVGIGTTAPGATLTVAGSISAHGTIYSNGSELGSSVAPSQEVFTSSGTWNRPTGVTRIHVMVTGSGGGGGGGGGSTAGSGGALSDYIDVTSVTSVTVTVGAAGNGATGMQNGGAGNTSSFGSYLVGNGGAGGIQGNSGTEATGTITSTNDAAVHLYGMAEYGSGGTSGHSAPVYGEDGGAGVVVVQVIG